MRQGNSRKWLALICSAVLLLSTVLVEGNMQYKEVKAATTGGAINPPTWMKELTLFDAGIYDNDAQGYAGTLAVDSLDGVLFGMNIQLGEEGSRFHYGAKGDGSSGIAFRRSGDDLVIGNDLAGSDVADQMTAIPVVWQTLDAGTAGLSGTFSNTEFLLQISTEFVDYGEDGQENDIKLGVYINGKLYDNTYFYIENNAPQLGTNINFAAGAPGYFSSHSSMTNPKDLNVWTAKEAGVPDGGQIGIAGTNLTGSMIGSTFSTLVQFPTNTQGTGNFWVGDELNGFLFQGSGENLAFQHYTNGNCDFSTTLTKEIAGTALTANASLKLDMTVEKAGTKGIKVGLYFNDVLYNEKYFYLAVSEATLARHITILVYSDLAATIYVKEPIEVPNNLNNITLLHAGLSDNNMPNYIASLGINSLNGTLFSMKLKTVANSRFQFGANGNNSASGFAFWVDDAGNLKIGNSGDVANGFTGEMVPGEWKTIAPSSVGVSSFAEEFLLQISTEYVDADGLGALNDIKLGVFINGRLCDNEYYYVNNATDRLGTTICFIVSPPVSFGSYLPDTALEEWTINDLGMENGSYAGYKAGAATGGDLKDKAFQTLVKFPEMTGSQYVNLWLGSEGNGFIFQAAPNGNLAFMYFAGGTAKWSTTLTPDVAGCKLVGNENLKLTLTTEYVEDNGTTTGLKLGVYFNDKLYGGNHFYLVGMTSAVLPQNIVLSPDSGTTTTWMSSPNLEPVAPPTDFTYLSLWDAGVPDASVKGASFFNNSEFTGVTSLNETLFSAYLRFSEPTGNEPRLNLGVVGVDGQPRGGIGFRFYGETMQIGNDCAGTANEGQLTNMPVVLATLKAETAGVGNSFCEQDFLFQTSIEFVDRDGNGGANDIKLGVYINGKLYSNMYYYILNCTDELGTCINVNYAPMDAYASYMPGDVEREDLYYNLANGSYLALVTTKNLTDGTEYAAGTDITTSGDYLATFSGIGNPTRNVILWKSGDAHPDGKFDVRDLVAVKKAALGKTLATKAGAKGAEEYADPAGLKEIRTLLIGTDTLPTVAMHLYDTDVMEIGAWFGPYLVNKPLSIDETVETGTGYDENGDGQLTANALLSIPSNAEFETNFIQDKYYKMLQDIGINTIQCDDMDANDEKESAYIAKNLAMAERYNIGVYITDTGIDNGANATTLVNHLQRYGKYSSFKGVFVGDEPDTASYQLHGKILPGHELEQMDAKATILNKYTNLFGYINLSRINVDTQESVYKQYLQDYYETCKPRQIMYCNYPYDHFSHPYVTQTEVKQWWFRNLKVVKEFSEEKGLPFGQWVQAGSNWHSGYSDTTTNNVPTEEQLRWVVNASLAYGATSVNYFTAIQPWYFTLQKDGGYDFTRNGLIGANGEKTQWYDYAKRINEWVAKVDHVLLNSNNIDTLAFGTHAQEITGATKTTDGILTNVGGVVGDGIFIGVFEYQGKRAYYIVNNSYSDTQVLDLYFNASKNMTIYQMSGEGNTVTGSGAYTQIGIEPGAATLIVIE